jgi:hypothetical protein
MHAHVLSTTLVASLLLAPLATAAAAQVVPETPAVQATAVIKETPAVQAFLVTFRDPVRVGDRILLGRYIIEHDNHRMARGEPCTYIYEASDPRLPVVVFHCTHLTRPAPKVDTVFLHRSGTYPLQELQGFQFAGEPASHGVPVIR